MSLINEFEHEDLISTLEEFVINFLNEVTP